MRRTALPAGVNNNFLVNTGHEIAIAHNDDAVLERYHAVVTFKVSLSCFWCNRGTVVLCEYRARADGDGPASFFQLLLQTLSRQDCNIFVSLDLQAFQKVRRTIIEVGLHRRFSTL